MRRRRATVALVVIAAIIFFALSFAVWKFAYDARPTVTERWALYVENLQPERKIFVLSSSQRYVASKEFAAKLLAIVKVKASIELSAWADVFYYIDAGDPSRWSVSWDRKSRLLSLGAPEPDCLPPAVRTDTIEISVKGSNLVTKTIFRLKEEAARMEDELSADLLVRARASLSDKVVRAGVREGIAGIGRSFCEAILGIAPNEVLVRLAGDP
ncbi:MAG: hypothetical protein CVV53_06790 [Spirochaetae bacterium HGW-Spirochaetae-9]|nr:MAG: hypothetical protein CVV53_06790 [Spirochaetae bacterium HGW-Spirochaetae-9]